MEAPMSVGENSHGSTKIDRKQSDRRAPRSPSLCQASSKQANRPTSSATARATKTLRAAASYLLLASLVQALVWAADPGADELQANSNRLPDLASGTSDEPITALVGQDVFVSCVARRLQNYTIIWRYSGEAGGPAGDEQGVILTAGHQRVTSDERFSVVQSHDTWLLKISNVRPADTGTYVCHTNSEPRVRALRIVSVLRPSAGSSDGSRAADLSDSRAAQRFADLDHDFTGCCRQELVRPRCQRLCSFQNLASRYQGINMVHECYAQLPAITRCMVGGRNVTDCCQRRHIPQRCNQMCGHQTDTSSMSLQDQSYCADYSAAIMSCVAEGISTLPGQPELVVVEAISPSTLKVSWQKLSDENELKKLDGWIIQLSKLSSFEDQISASGSLVSQQQATTAKSSSSPKSSDSATEVSSSFSTSSLSSSDKSAPMQPLAGLTIVDASNSSSLASLASLLNATSGTISLKVDKRTAELTIDRLKPYTVYQIQMFAYNSQGRSQLTDPIRALTLAPDSESASSAAQPPADDSYVEPSLPDTRRCCQDRGVTLKRCLDTMCDPVEADKASIADLMICAPWSNVTFSCLSSRTNHTDCCKAKGVSPFCLNMCSGDVKRVDYRHFRCLAHMSSYTNCILESHNVLPGPPSNFTVGPITSSWAVLNWRAPAHHARSLHGYRIFWRQVEAASAARPSAMGETSPNNEDYLYSRAEAATNPYLLDGLSAATVYEAFVVSVNRFGESESSSRFIFQTLADPEQDAGGDDIESRLPLQGNGTTVVAYNETRCCQSSGMTDECLGLCSYDLKVNDVSGLIARCSSQIPVMLRCLAGSRNSVPCCRSRQVSDQCLNACAGLSEHSPLVLATRCAPDFGKIIRCMDEGSKQIPGAPGDLRVTDIRSDRVQIAWAPAKEDTSRHDIEYHVRYQQLQQLDKDSSERQDLSSLIAVVPLHPLEHNLIQTTNKTEITVDKLRPLTRYSLYITAENSYGISLPSLVLVIQTPDETTINAPGDEYRRNATLGAAHSLELLRADTESLSLKWLAPLFNVPDAPTKYRVFYKMLGPSINTTSGSTAPAAGGAADAPVEQVSSNWTVLETSDTSAVLRNLRYSSQYVITVQAFSRQHLGHMSEILLASTARPVAPSLNQPLVIGNPVEGHNITLMCVALGQPTPQISMFINGLLVQKRSQPYVVYHLVNLQRGHLTISCFASNGHGKEFASVQSRTEISVKFAARASTSTPEAAANFQSTARLMCQLAGNPQPTVVWKFAPAQGNAQPQVLLPSTDRISLVPMAPQFDTPFSWVQSLTIKNVSSTDAGRYFCVARNGLGESSATIQLKISDRIAELLPDSSSSANKIEAIEQTNDMMDCCRSQNVSAACQAACTVDGLDLGVALRLGECQRELDKLMYCAADGRDHRNCCRSRQVPPSCMRWCSGAKINIPAVCYLSSAYDINQCFQEGRSLLPGPPQNLRAMLASESRRASEQAASSSLTDKDMAIDRITLQEARQPSSAGANQTGPVISSMVMMMGDHQRGSLETSEPQQQEAARQEPIVIEWEAPSKNPQLVQYYRIFWRPFGSRELSRTVTNLTWISLSELDANKMYEFVVKAANAHGSSVYSDPLTVKPGELLAESSAFGSGGLVWLLTSSGASSVFGRILAAVSFASLFMFGSLGLVIMLERRGYLKRFASSKSNTSRISFANPAYLKDSMDTTGSSDDPDTSPISWDHGSGGHSLDVLSSPSGSGSSSPSPRSSPHEPAGRRSDELLPPLD